VIVIGGIEAGTHAAEESRAVKSNKTPAARETDFPPTSSV